MASALDIGSSTASFPTAAGASAKVNPVALEVPVLVTGARPGDSSGKRELFTEATKTVVVFENGGVIRLAAAVNPGQLLFLTHQESKREVIAEVMRKRAFRPTSCFVELEFTEKAEGFWGIEFPAQAEEVPLDGEQTEAAELVKSAPEPGDVPTLQDGAPRDGEVDVLRQEVAALREQLRALVQAPGAATVGAEEELQPKPAPEFQKNRALAGGSSKTRKSGALRTTLVCSALLMTAAGAAWHEHWIPGLPGVARIPGAPPSAAQASKFAAAHPAAGRVHEAIDSSKTSPVNVASTGQAAMPDSSEHHKATGKVAAVLLDAKTAPRSEAAGHREAAEKPRPASAGQRSPLPGAGNTVASSGKVIPEEGVTQPPRLIKSVRAIAPPAAVRGFVTGNVSVDALVDASGRVTLTTVLSGPPSLREAAVETVKQYQYEPATINGKPVSAHVKVKLQFWFEP